MGENQNRILPTWPELRGHVWAQVLFKCLQWGWVVTLALIAWVGEWIRGASRKEIGWVLITIIVVGYAAAWFFGLKILRKYKNKKTETVQISAERCETKLRIGKEYVCEIHVSNLPKESGNITAFLTSWIPAPSEQIQHKISHTERIPKSTDFPILLPTIEDDPKQPEIRRFKCFHMSQEGKEPTIEIASQQIKFLSFQTSNPIFKITIEIRRAGEVLGTEIFQIEFVRGSGNIYPYFRIEKD
jgi:hypothetical protein